MLKIIKLLPIALLTLVPNYEENETTLYIESVSISGSTSYSQIFPRYTCTKNYSTGLKFVYSYTTDGVYHDAGTRYIDSISICKKKPPELSNEILVSSLGKYNTFTVEMIPDDPTLKRETITLVQNKTGNKVVNYKEENNDIGLSSGYITQTYNIDPSLNKTREDRIMFLNFENNMVIPSYNYFDISTLKFKYLNAIYPSPRGNFYFDFIDYFGLFNELPIESGTMYRRLPLECVIDGDVCYFQLKNELYYNPETHETSSAYKDGYYPTRKLYFPTNSYDLLKQLTCRIVMDIKGYTSFTMNAEFNILHQMKLFGECEDSEYCIHSTEDTIPNKREKEVEIVL